MALTFNSRTSSTLSSSGDVIGRRVCGINYIIAFLNFFFQWVGSIDVNANDQADANILVKLDQSWTEQNASVLSEVSSAIGSDQVDAILCVAGGWAGGNAKSDGKCNPIWQNESATQNL